MLAERRHADELMDDPALDAATYHAVLADLARVNRLTLAHRPTLAFLDRAVGNRTSFRLLERAHQVGAHRRIVFGQQDTDHLVLPTLSIASRRHTPSKFKNLIDYRR